MIKLYEIHDNGRRTEIASFGTYDEAEKFASTSYNIFFFENDGADCADFLTHSGGQYAIQPA